MENITFEEAIAYTEGILSRSDLDDMNLESEISTLVQTINGARGFFVCFLTGDWQLADAPSTSVIRALQSAPNTISELLVKNLAMSTAMAITHRRSGNVELAEGSDLVAKRTVLLIEKVDLEKVRAIATKVKDAAISNTGEYADFLERWGYDTEQKQAIAQILTTVLANV